VVPPQNGQNGHNGPKEADLAIIDQKRQKGSLTEGKTGLKAIIVQNTAKLRKKDRKGPF